MPSELELSLAEGVSVTLKEMSMQMADEDERLRMYALLTCIITVVFDIFLGTAAFVCAAVTDSSAGYAFAVSAIPVHIVYISIILMHVPLIMMVSRYQTNRYSISLGSPGFLKTSKELLSKLFRRMDVLGAVNAAEATCLYSRGQFMGTDLSDIYLDCLLDVLAATLVVWRFYGSTSTHSDFKENVACICLGILFCLSSIGIMAKSTHDLAVHHIPQQLMYVFILAGVGGVMNSVLGCVKYMLGKRMKSQSLILEAINTSLSAILAMMLAVSDILYFYHPSAWTIDPITSIVVAVILFVGGLKVLCRRKHNPETTPLLVGVAV